jgi:hypothetical protein
MNNRKERASSSPDTGANDTSSIVEDVQQGELTGAKAAEKLQEAARRRAAEEGPELDTNEDGTITRGGFGSGQGMECG